MKLLPANQNKPVLGDDFAENCGALCQHWKLNPAQYESWASSFVAFTSAINRAGGAEARDHTLQICNTDALMVAYGMGLICAFIGTVKGMQSLEAEFLLTELVRQGEAAIEFINQNEKGE